jgi:hypothetical protein
MSIVLEEKDETFQREWMNVEDRNHIMLDRSFYRLIYPRKNYPCIVVFFVIYFDYTKVPNLGTRKNQMIVELLWKYKTGPDVQKVQIAPLKSKGNPPPLFGIMNWRYPGVAYDKVAFVYVGY